MLRVAYLTNKRKPYIKILFLINKGISELLHENKAKLRLQIPPDLSLKIMNFISRRASQFSGNSPRRWKEYVRSSGWQILYGTRH